MAEIPGPELYEAARLYAGRGWPVLPIAPGGKVPVKEVGLFEHGVQDAKRSPYWLERYWKRWPGANVGLAAGETAGFWVLDADVKAAGTTTDGKAIEAEDGHATLRLLEELFGDPLPPTLGQETPSGGRHWLFEWPGKAVPNSARRRLGPGLDTRGDGGYILAAPSIHPNGKRYAWVGGDPASARPAKAPEWLLRLLFGEPDDTEWLRERLDALPLPAWLAKRIGRPVAAAPKPARAAAADRISPYARAALDEECRIVRATLPGNQNNALNMAAFKLGGLVGAGALPEGLARAQLIAAASNWQYDPRQGPWRPEHIARIVETGLAAGAQHPRSLPPPPEATSAPGGGGRGTAAVRRPAPPPPPSAEAVDAARALWAQRRPVAGTPAAALLEGLGLDPAAPWPMLGYVDSLEVVLARRQGEPQRLDPTPALIAGMGRWTASGSVERSLAAVYVVHLDRAGRGLKVAHPDTGREMWARRYVGAWAGAAVRLTPVFAPRLILASGLTDGLRALAARRDLPVWVAGQLWALPRVVLPDAVEEVLILGAERAGAETERQIAAGLGHRSDEFQGRRAVRFVRPARAEGRRAA